MPGTRGGTTAGSLLLLAGCAVATLAAVRLASGPWQLTTRLLTHGLSGPAQPDFTDLVTAVCTGALVAAVLWLTVTTALVTLAHLTRSLAPVSSPVRVAADRVELAGPPVIRRFVGAVLGLAVSAGAAGPAYAGPGLPDPPAHRAALELRHPLDGLALPGRVVDTDGPPVTASLRAPPRRHPATVVVVPGDSLWSISARLLGPGATAPEITAAWHRLHRANRGRLSADPDLIVPGTALVVPDPPPTAPSRKEPPR